jgi:hypothetical protein
MLALWLEQRLYNATGSDDIMVEIAVVSGRDKRSIIVGTTVILWLRQRSIMVGVVVALWLDWMILALWL